MAVVARQSAAGRWTATSRQTCRHLHWTVHYEGFLPYLGTNVALEAGLAGDGAGVAIDESGLCAFGFRAGAGTLYFTEDDGERLVSTCLSSFDVEKRRACHEEVAKFVLGAYQEQGTTLWEGVRALESGIASDFTGRRIALHAPIQSADDDAPAALERYLVAYLQSLQGRVALLFSGGLDSSTLAMACRVAGIQPLLITLATQTKEATELEHARYVADELGFEWQVWPPRGADARFPYWHVQNGPLVPLLEALAAKGVRTVVSGGGGDALFYEQPQLQWLKSPRGHVLSLLKFGLSLIGPEMFGRLKAWGAPEWMGPILRQQLAATVAKERRGWRSNLRASSRHTAMLTLAVPLWHLAAARSAQSVRLSHPLASCELSSWTQQLPLQWRRDRHLLRTQLRRRGLTKTAARLGKANFSEENRRLLLAAIEGEGLSWLGALGIVDPAKTLDAFRRRELNTLTMTRILCMETLVRRP